ncbi:MAG: translocation/assembly module TamB domain-containing protein [Rubrivivax sp.]|nr:translocation/assembly module TamB domain-containing protein [Rubrivivax sp.]
MRATLSLLTPLAWVLGAAVLAAVALAWAARWVLFTEAGTAWLLGHLPMVTEARGVQGALLGPRWQAERLRVQWDGGRQWLLLEGLVSDGMAWHWRPAGEDSGLWLALRVERLQARKVHVETGPPGPRPLPLPASLAPPLRVEVVRASVGELRVDRLEPATDVAAEELRFDGRVGRRHGVAQLTGRAYGVHVRASASLANARPFELAAEATVAPALVVEADAPPWAAVLRANGPLQAFELAAVLRGRPVAGAGRGTTRQGPALDVNAVVHPLEAWPVQRLSGRTTALDLSALHGAAPQTRLEGDIEVRAAARDAPVAIRLGLRNLEPGRWNERRVPVARLELEASGELARPDRAEFKRFELHLAGAHGAPEGSAGRVDGRATWAGPQLELEARLHDVHPQLLDGRAPAMTVGGPLRLTISGLPAVGSAGASAPAGARATREPWRVAGQLELEGRVDGAPRAVAVRAEGQGSAGAIELRHLQVRSGDAQAVLRFSAARAPSREWTLASEGSLAEFDPVPWWPGEVGSAWRQGPHRLNAGWQFELRAPADALQLAQAQPVALLQRLAGNGQLRLHDSMLAGVPLIGEVNLGYRVAVGAPPGRLHADLQLGGNRIVVDGQGDPAGSGSGDRWRAEVRAATLASLAALTRLGPALAGWVPRQGSVQADLTAEGRWPRMATQGQVRAEDLRVGELALARAQAAWRIDLSELTAARAPLSLDAQADGVVFGQRRVEALRAELRGTLADHRLALRAALPVAPGAATEKVLNISGRGGTLASLQASGQWQPESAGGGRWLARIDELDVGPAEGAPAVAAATAAAASAPASAPAPAGATPPAPSARWAEARNLRAQFVFDAGGRLASLSAEPGRVRLAESFALRWDAVQVDMRTRRADFALRADIEPFALPPLLRRLQPQIGWQGDLRLAARVDIRAAERFEADLVFRRHDGDLHVLTQGELQLLGLTDFRLQVKARDGLWEFEPVFSGRGLGEMRGRLRARTAPERRWPDDDAPIEGQLRARVPDIGVWGHWVPPGWRLVGELTTTAEVGGRFGAPTYTGELAGRGLGVRNLLQGVNVGDGRLLVRLAGTQARIETFTLKGGDGTASVTGQADLGEKPSARLKLEADQFRVLGRVDRMLTASGQAELALAADTSRLDGRFRIDEGLFDFTRADAPSLDEDVTVRGVEAADVAARPDAEAAGRPQRFTMAVDVDLGTKLRAKGRGVDTGLTGAVRITNPGGRLQLRGTIESVEGTYAAYGQKLELEKGSLAFSGPPDNPWLDIWAVRPNLDIRVGLQVSGPLQGLRVRLFSDPEMSETDKLSWLVLGRASDGLGRNDTALLQRAAVALLAGEGEAPTDAFMRRLGIDELSLKQSEGDVRETVVILGKQLSRRWYVGYERGVNATTGTWQLIYRVAQRFTVRAQSGLENSLDFIWTVRLQQPPDDGGVRRSLPAVPP